MKIYGLFRIKKKGVQLKAKFQELKDAIECKANMINPQAYIIIEIYE